MTSIINGFCVGILWSGLNQYIADLATEHTKGLFFSFFWCFYMSSEVFGNLISAFLLGYMSQTVYFAIIALIAVCATVGMSFLKESDEQSAVVE